MNTLLLLIAVGVLSATARLSDVPSSCSGSRNPFPINSASPTLQRQIRNGKVYRAGTARDPITVLHVWGTPYEQGYAQGAALQAVIKNVSVAVYRYLEEEVERYVPWLPSWLIDLVITKGASWALQVSFNWTRPYTPANYLEEMQGIADGAGVPVEDVQNLNQFPELTKAACTVVGATNRSSTTGRIMHLRALDFDPTCPIADYAQVTVYHNPDGTSVATFGWSGMIGALTGFSSTGVGIGEKVWDNHPLFADGVHGTPWMFLLRDALSSTSMGQALNGLRRANRTCAIHVGIGDTSSNTFRGVTMAKRAFDVYTDRTLNYTEHPILPGIVYWDKNSQPTTHYCLRDLLQGAYGKIDAPSLALGVSSIGETGDMHSVAFDYTAKTAYVAVARRTFATDGQLNAYTRQFTRLDMAKLFREAAP